MSTPNEWEESERRAWQLRARQRRRSFSVNDALAALFVLMAMVLVVGLTIVLWGNPNILKPAIVGFLAFLTLLFAVSLLIDLFRGDELALENRWRGFGGGLGGWRASVALGLLVAVLSFGCLTVFASAALQPKQDMTIPTPQPTAQAPAVPIPALPVN